MRILILLILVIAVKSWDHIMFTQVWPPSWLSELKDPSYKFTKFNNTYFTIHGIWPQYTNGSWPQYCKGKRFDTTKLKPIYDKLVKYWTNFKNPYDLWTHEYYKHMTCLEKNNYFTDEYTCFKYGLLLRNNINIFELLAQYNILPNNDFPYNTTYVQNVLNIVFGYQTVITCEKDILTEIRMCYSPTLKPRNCSDDALKFRCNKNKIWYPKWIN